MVELPITLPQDHTLSQSCNTPTRTCGSARHISFASEMRWRSCSRTRTTRTTLGFSRAIEDCSMRSRTTTPSGARCRGMSRHGAPARCLKDPGNGGGWRSKAPPRPGKGAVRNGDGSAAGLGAEQVRRRRGRQAGRAASSRIEALATSLMIVENLPLGIDQRVRKQVKDLLGSGYRVSVVTRGTRRTPVTVTCRASRCLTTQYTGRAAQDERIRSRVRGVLRMGSRLSTAARLRGSIDVVQLCQPPDIYFPLTRLLRWAARRSSLISAISCLSSHPIERPKRRSCRASLA